MRRPVATALLALALAGCGSTAASDGAPRPTRPVEHQQHGQGRQGWPAPVEMHSLTSPRAPGGNRATTYGLGDLDGDGRADLVQVRTDGRVSAELTTVGHRAARLPRDPTLRLQALPDLDDDGHAEVLVASTAGGCCQGYRLTDSRSAVLAVVDGGLRRLRWPSGEPVSVLFDRGSGEVYAGIRCDRDAVHLLRAVGQGATARATDTSVRITGDVARRGTTLVRTVPSDDVRAETRSHCPGLDAQGWAD